MHSVDRQGRVGGGTQQQAYIVATLGQLEADLQLVERSVDLGQDQVTTVVEEAELVVGCARQRDDIRIRIIGSQVGGTGYPAGALKYAILAVLEVLAQRQSSGTAEGSHGASADEGVAVAVEADTDVPVGRRSQASDVADAGGVASLEDSPVDSAFHTISNLIGGTGFSVPIDADAVFGSSGGKDDRNAAAWSGASAAAHQNLVDIVYCSFTAGSGRSRCDVAGVLIEVE